ncbi:MAG: Tn3 family transposase [Jatrophihabitans sp.]
MSKTGARYRRHSGAHQRCHSHNGLARHQINTDLIATHRDDLLRVAGSLATGTVRASELLRVLQGGGRPTPLGRAVAELGRIPNPLPARLPRR